MATFLQGVQDHVRGIRPPDDNLKFDAQLLQSRQSAYDKNHKALSKMYGTILNAGLTRDDNIMAREEFFKLIETDLHKIAGMDLSLESNQVQASNVFKQIYTNKALAKDMVWTKNFQSELQRAEGFRNCTDPEKCGGQYWEDGIKYMQYKREEFKNATRDESMGFQDVRYIPYNNMVEQAMKDFKELGVDVQSVDFSTDGKYKITMKNGEQIVEPLTNLFSGLYSRNPEFHDMYKVMAYNNRKDWTYNAVASGEYASLEEAAVGYVEKNAERFQRQFDILSKGAQEDTDMLQQKYDAYLKDYQNGELTQEEAVKMQETQILLEKSKELDGYLNMVRSAQKNMHNQSSMNAIADMLDNTSAMLMFKSDIESAAETFASLTSVTELEEDKFALEQQRFEHDVALEGVKQANRIELEKTKAALGAYDRNKASSADTAIARMNWENKVSDAENFEVGAEFLAALAKSPAYKAHAEKNGITADSSIEDIQKMVDAIKGSSSEPATLKGAAAKALNDVRDAQNKKRRDANIYGIKALEDGVSSDDITFNWEFMSDGSLGDLEGLVNDGLYDPTNIPNRVLIENNEAVIENGVKPTVYKKKGYPDLDFVVTASGKMMYTTDKGLSWKKATKTKLNQLTLQNY